MHVATEYARHLSHLNLLDDVGNLEKVLSQRGGELSRSDQQAVDLGRSDEDAGDPLQSIIGAVLGRHDRVILRIEYDGRTKVYYRGTVEPQALSAIPAGTADKPIDAAALKWNDVSRLGPVPLDDKGRFWILTGNQYGPFIVDFVVHELWPSIIAGAVLSVVISFLAYSFVRRRYAEVEKERAKFADFAGSASDFFWEMDKHLRFSYFSDRFTQFTGVPQSELLGKTRLELGNPGASNADWSTHLEALYTRKPFKNFVHPRTKSDGSVVWLSINGAPFFENGTFAGFRGTGSDITAQRAIQAQLIVAKDEAQKANIAKTEFLAAMSHDLRTPLNAILGFSDAMRYQYFGPIDDKYGEYVENIHKSGQLLLSLVEEVLDLSAIEAGKRTMSPENLDLSVLLTECRNLHEPLAKSAKIDLAFDTSATSIPFVADKTAVQQILQNLVSNAIKFTPPGGSVQIKGTMIGDNIAVSVRDTGHGMNKAQIRRATEPFEKGLSMAEMTGKGWGLGLSIVKRLVELLDGTLHIESTPGAGTLVSFSIPRGQIQYLKRAAS